jgi:hypothetical protein
MIGGQVQATAPDYNKAAAAARRLYRIIMAQKVCRYISLCVH